jgi:predicted phosphodiesterase
VENTFHTARAPGSTYTFAIQADSHLDSNSNPQVYMQTLANEKASEPDFTIDLGDTFMTEKYTPYTAAAAQYLAQRYYFSQVAQIAPLFLTLGNHDGEGASRGNSGNETSAWAARMRTTYFPNPVPGSFYTGNTTPDETVGMLQDYYAWQWGDALFVVLDPYHFTPSSKDSVNDLWNRTLGSEQYQWLKTTLENSSAKWKFLFIHQLISGTDQNMRGGVEVAGYYEWGGNNLDGTWGFTEHRPGWAMPIHQLLVANHVTAVFHGHDHLFAKQELDGIIYQEVPQPSTARANNTGNAAQYGYLTGDILGSSGYLRIKVTPDEVTVEYVRTYLPQDEKSGQQNGQVDFTYTINYD